MSVNNEEERALTGNSRPLNNIFQQRRNAISIKLLPLRGCAQNFELGPPNFGPSIYLPLYLSVYGAATRGFTLGKIPSARDIRCNRGYEGPFATAISRFACIPGSRPHDYLCYAIWVRKRPVASYYFPLEITRGARKFD